MVGLLLYASRPIPTCICGFVRVRDERRGAGGGMVDLTREEYIDVMIDAMPDLQLHLQDGVD